MRLTMILFSLMFCSLQAFGQTEDDINATYAKKYEELGNAQGKAQMTYLQAVDEVNALQKSVDNLKAETEQASKNDKRWAPTHVLGITLSWDRYNEQNHNKLVELQNQLKAEETKLENAKTKMETAQSAVNDVTDAYTEANQNKNTDIQNLKKRYTALEKELTSSRLLVKFSDLQNKLDRTQDTLNVIEAKFDQAVLGIYLQRKIGEVLNSKALCTSIASCSQSGKASADANAMKEIFPKLDKNNYSDPKGSSSAH